MSDDVMIAGKYQDLDPVKQSIGGTLVTSVS